MTLPPFEAVPVDPVTAVDVLDNLSRWLDATNRAPLSQAELESAKIEIDRSGMLSLVAVTVTFPTGTRQTATALVDLRKDYRVMGPDNVRRMGLFPWSWRGGK